MSIQKIMDCIPSPGPSGPQISIYINRGYPVDPDRYVVRVLRKSFFGNDIEFLLNEARNYMVAKRPELFTTPRTKRYE